MHNGNKSPNKYTLNFFTCGDYFCYTVIINYKDEYAPPKKIRTCLCAPPPFAAEGYRASRFSRALRLGQPKAVCIGACAGKKKIPVCEDVNHCT